MEKSSSRMENVTTDLFGNKSVILRGSDSMVSASVSDVKVVSL